MSAFQGPGTGITGTSNQFTVGNSQSSGYSNSYAGSTGNVNGYAPQAGYVGYAATATNIQSSNGINGTNWAWSGQNGTPGHLWGSNDGNYMAVWSPGQMYVGSAGYANQSATNTLQVANAGMATYTTSVNNQYTNSTWSWGTDANVPSSTPNHFWGSNDGNYYPVWQYGQMYMGSAQTATNAGSSSTCQTAQNYANSNISNLLQGSQNNIGGNINIGWRALYVYTMQGSIQNVDGNFFTIGYQGSNIDRFRVYYLPEQNLTQWGAFSNGWYANSDVRDKVELEDLSSDTCRNFIKQLRPRKFKWKYDKSPDDVDRHDRAGFIAQEVLSAASNVQDTSLFHIINHGDEYLEGGGSLDTTNFDYESSNNLPTMGLSLSALTSPLVKTVQSIIVDIDALKIRINGLKQKFNIQ